jgi:hypothetical protein
MSKVVMYASVSVDGFIADEVRLDVVPIVFGSGKRYFGAVEAQQLLEDPDAVIHGERVVHLRYQTRRQAVDRPQSDPTVASIGDDA